MMRRGGGGTSRLPQGSRRSFRCQPVAALTRPEVRRPGMVCTTERFTLAQVRYVLSPRIKRRLRNAAPGSVGWLECRALLYGVPYIMTRTFKGMARGGPLGFGGGLAHRAVVRHHIARLVRSGGVRADTTLDPHGVAYRVAVRVTYRGRRPIISEIGY